MEIEIGENPVVLNFNNGETVQVQRQFWNKNKLDEYDFVRATKQGKLILFYGENLSEDAKSKLESTKEVQTEFDVKLDSFGDKKINVIKVVKDLMGLGLKEAMNLVGSAPVVLAEGISNESAIEMKQKLEDIGAKVSIK